MVRHRINAPKAVKDRSKTLRSKAFELHGVIRDNRQLGLPGRVATIAETKTAGVWEVFLSSANLDEFPIDFSVGIDRVFA
jgi:hypothetical protein